MPPDEILPPDNFDVLEVLIACPKPLCATEFGGIWIAPDEPGSRPAASLQLCPGCGHIWDEPYPGYSFTAEA